MPDTAQVISLEERRARKAQAKQERAEREQVSKCIHPDLLPAQSRLCLEPPPPNCPEKERVWLLGFVSKDGDFIPLGRVGWFGDIEPGSEFIDERGQAHAESEEHDDTPEVMRDFVYANLPAR